jgi:hypothetical protein
LNKIAPSATVAERAFKTAWFAKAAKKAHVDDKELCEAIRQAVRGQCDDLGGGVYKKRLNRNMHRSIILAKGRVHWIFEYIFAKKDRDNITSDELDGFRKLADAYGCLADEQISMLLGTRDLMEICNDVEA